MLFVSADARSTEHNRGNADLALPIDRPADKRLEILPPPIEKKEPLLDLPPFEIQKKENPSIKDLLNFVARKFRFEGNTIFTDQVLAALIDKFRLTPINALDLEELRVIITNYYIEHGYINSGALFPDQNLLGGILIIEITEGVLSEVNIQNPGRLSTRYIEQRLRLHPNEPLNLNKVRKQLQRLQQDPRIERINASLVPGDSLGSSRLNMAITEAKPYSLSLEVNNHRPPSIGETQTIVHVSHNNISGNGDTIDATLNKTEGLTGGDMQYAYPVTHFDSKVYVGGSRHNIDIITEPFKDQGFDIQSYSLNTGFRSPVLKRKNERYDIDLKFEYKSLSSNTNLEACADSPAETITNIAALRLRQSLVERFNSDVFLMSHTLNVGINAFNSQACAGDDPDSQFTSWLWQLLWSHKYKWYKVQTIVRGDFQFSQQPLLSAEKFSVGGANSVRGFRENFLVRDSGRFFSAEARLPLRTTRYRKLSMEAMLFSDYGTGRNHIEQIDTTISSLGIGYRWRYDSGFLAELFWAHPIKGGNKNIDDGLQDDGIHAKIWLDLF